MDSRTNLAINEEKYGDDSVYISIHDDEKSDAGSYGTFSLPDNSGKGDSNSYKASSLTKKQGLNGHFYTPLLSNDQHDDKMNSHFIELSVFSAKPASQPTLTA